MDEIRVQVCSRCIEKPPGGPPCAPLGKQCGIELNLPRIIEAVHSGESGQMDPYIDALHDGVCANCTVRATSQCPCPLEYLLLLAVQAVEGVDDRRRNAAALA
jgi:hypothetical protein